MKHLLLLILGFSLIVPGNIIAQTDTTNVFQDAPDVNLAKDQEKFKTKLLPSLIVPGILIGYGLTTIKDNGLYSSYDARRDIRKAFPNFNNRLDDIMIFVPYGEILLLNLFKIKCQNDWINTSLLILKSELLMTAIVFPLKNLLQQERPYSYQLGLDGVPLEERKQNKNAFHSLPSGHTAHAFLAASIVHKEYRQKSIWYGIGAYGIATTVAAFRMLNDKHWQSDVIVGAGIGILSTHIVYATHKHKWGRKEVCFVPTFNKNSKGFLMTYNF